MGKFDGYLICTDLDGTFTEGLKICADNAELVKYFQENGGLFTVATGRLPEHFDGFENFRPNCPVITHNGAVIYDLEKKEVLYKKELSPSFCEVAEYVLSDKNTKRVIMNEMYCTKEICSTAEITSGTEYYKIVMCTEPEAEAIQLRDRLLEKFGGSYCIFRAWNTGIECLAKDTNKGTAVARLRKMLGDRVKKVICVGDCENDSFMLREADIGYAVGNASEEAKRCADRITVDFRAGAAAQIIRDLEKELM